MGRGRGLIFGWGGLKPDVFFGLQVNGPISGGRGGGRGAGEAFEVNFF